ncbi:uncharacterized protein VTP21DRAFT_5950 [Calcarisporiella thermophila]|uniref:uncharacterized protein n=1 Tax=Calcarisporiella thermophila TaxID=911321 RepID=UPI003741FF70
MLYSIYAPSMAGVLTNATFIYFVMPLRFPSHVPLVLSPHPPLPLITDVHLPLLSTLLCFASDCEENAPIPIPQGAVPVVNVEKEIMDHFHRGPPPCYVRNRGVRQKGNEIEVDIEVNSKRVVVSIAQSLSLLHRPGMTGVVVWDSALALLLFAMKHRHWLQLSSMHVLELGCGVGLVGIGLGYLTRGCILTDRASVVELARKNIRRNPGIQEKVTARELLWEVKDDIPLPAWVRCDLLVAADCAYNDEVIEPFVSTLARICRQGRRTLALLSQELRSAEVHAMFLERILAAGFAMYRVPDRMLEGLGIAGVAIYLAWLREMQVEE